jgi:thiazole synthase ThiGH ThiG subunit
VIVHNAHDPATMAAALALTVDQGDAGKRGNQRDTLAQ